MPCFSPHTAYQAKDGTIVFSELKKYDAWRTLTLACGQCIGCRLERSRQWAVRCMHEAQLHEHNAFVTLTYDDAHLPGNGSLKHRDFQLFLKRLRKAIAAKVDGAPGRPAPAALAALQKRIAYYMCGEYGDETNRPHYHACLFGVDFTDKKPISKNAAGQQLYESKTLEKLWEKGLTTTGAVTFQSAAYIARYVMKKITGQQAKKHYERINLNTGEIYEIEPEYNQMSRRPGIAANWLKKYTADVYPHGKVVVNAIQTQPPRYYDKLYEKMNPEEHDWMKYQRGTEQQTRAEDNTDERLKVKEKVKLAAISKLKRSIK